MNYRLSAQICVVIRVIHRFSNMPQSKSAKKSLRQSEKKRLLNRRYKNKMKRLIKEFKLLLKEGKKATAEKLLPQVYKAIDKAAKKNIIKKGNASRKKSRLTAALNKLSKAKKTEKTATKKASKKTSSTKKAASAKKGKKSS